jgi:hypothetical protein
MAKPQHEGKIIVKDYDSMRCLLVRLHISRECGIRGSRL